MSEKETWSDEVKDGYHVEDRRDDFKSIRVDD